MVDGPIGLDFSLLQTLIKVAKTPANVLDMRLLFEPAQSLILRGDYFILWAIPDPAKHRSPFPFVSPKIQNCARGFSAVGLWRNFSD